jgi:hypothetical protein
VEISDDEVSNDEVSDDDPRLRPYTYNCDQIRRKINTFINNGGMKVGEFQRAIDVSANSYRNFMTQNGRTKGIESTTYAAAERFFQKRDLKGEKMPRKPTLKKAKKDNGSDDNTKSGSNAKGPVDVSDVYLDGEEDEDVPIFDTCDEVRRKIRAHLRQDGVTQAAFARDLSASFPGDHKVSAAQVRTFLGKKGARAGGNSDVFYGAYVYFEKVRIKTGKPKSKHRMEMEEVWDDLGGMDREGECRVIVPRDGHAYYDEFGRFRFNR